jgi:hypothetical protein
VVQYPFTMRFIVQSFYSYKNERLKIHKTWHEHETETPLIQKESTNLTQQSINLNLKSTPISTPPSTNLDPNNEQHEE